MTFLVLPVIQQTSLETPLIQTTVTTHLSLLPVLDLIDAMEGVRDFYLRNSDGTFILDYVLTPTVTLDIPKYERVAGSGEPNIFDSTGQFFQQSEIQWPPSPELAYFGEDAKIRAALLSPKYNYEGAAFEGILNILIQDSNESNNMYRYHFLPNLRW